MWLFRLQSARFHAIADYAVAGALVIVAGGVGGLGMAVGSWARAASQAHAV
jgi:hypothetical protein